jgi:hypothetical protein
LLLYVSLGSARMIMFGCPFLCCISFDYEKLSSDK